MCRNPISAEGAPGSQVRCPYCDGVVTIGGTAGASGFPMGYAPVGPAPRQGLAIAALVCGIAGLVACPIVGIVGLVLGIVALTRIGRQPTEYGGRGLAIAGICTGGLGLVMIPLMIAILLPSLSRARELSKRTVCSANIKGIGTALQTYASANQGAFPESEDDWVARLGVNVSNMQLVCPSTADVPGMVSYHYVPGYTTGSDPNQIIVYEDPSNHMNEGGNVMYLDGRVQFVKTPQLQPMISSIKLPNGRPYTPK